MTMDAAPGSAAMRTSSGGRPAPAAAACVEPDDADLARRAAAGDPSAAGQLIERYQAMVRKFLRRLTGRDDLADDLAQDTFVRLLRYVDRYDPKYPMRTWLLTIARRLTINRAQRDRRMIATDDFSYHRCEGPQPGDAAQKGDEQRRLRAQLGKALSTLSEAQRQAVVLFHQQELSVQEVAQVMGLPVGTVKSHLHRGRAAMRKLLIAQNEVPQP
ncbi:MAG: sigma-70 family RNA polymerase sigma factor [Planctomycetes bacterium]|nr:sigma-70 family RNA polymerase sigma factor [Planctomycetota bacterium]